MIPVNNVRDNIKALLNDFANYDTYSPIYEQYMASRLDNWTDAVILMASGYTDESSAIEQAMASRYYAEDGSAFP